MIDIIIAFGIGLFVGALAGFFAFALCAIQKKED